MKNLPCFHIFRFLIFLVSIKVSLAADTVTPASFIRDGEKLVSSSQRFELGFFSPGKSKSRYLGIWYQQGPDIIVWVANRDRPIFDHKAVLTISSNGNLVLLNQKNRTIWSTNVSSEVKNPVAQLLDNGNLVVRDNASTNPSTNYLWQSFDYPTDTLLQDMRLGWDLKNGLERYLSSWQSADDPSQGNFTYRLDIHVLPKLCTYNGSVKFTCTGQWNGFAFVGAPYSYFLYDQGLMENDDEISFRYESYNHPSITVLKLDHSGQLTRLIWNERRAAWDQMFSIPDKFFGKYGYCGANTIFSFDQTPICQCLKGFKLKSQDKQTGPITCERSHTSDCKSGDQFIQLDDFKAPDMLEVSINGSMNLSQCQAECLKNCTCRAYANSKLTGGGSGCLMWFGDLIDLKKSISNFIGQSVYIRLPAPEQGNKKVLWIIVILILPVVLLPSFYIFRRRRRKHKQKETMNMETNQDLLAFDINMSITTRTNEFDEANGDRNDESNDSWLPLFSVASVAAATENFSTQCKLGEGGFGPVYKGRLLNGQEVAVKRLSSQSRQGLKEFKNEIMLIAKLQHRNLVRLLGCCLEQGEKILIYEHMVNKSLDVFLFDPTKKHLLGWQLRVGIIDGIAQVLLYLHQYSRLRIIHRDLKASNILLDRDMNPKIFDFGMARMFAGDKLQGNTKRIVGTYGYMSPEYALGGLFSIKSDVFSFGVLMLEILSSKRNTGVYNTDSFNLLGHAWDLWKNERAQDLTEPIIMEDEVPFPMLMRYINVALLCVQANAADRPTMSDVVSMFHNEHLNLPPPKEPAFTKGKNVKNSSDSHGRASEFCSVNNVTVSLINPR